MILSVLTVFMKYFLPCLNLQEYKILRKTAFILMIELPPLGFLHIRWCLTFESRLISIMIINAHSYDFETFSLESDFSAGILCIGKTFSATCHARVRLTCSSAAASNVCVDFAASTFFNTVRRLSPFFC